MGLKDKLTECRNAGDVNLVFSVFPEVVGNFENSANQNEAADFVALWSLILKGYKLTDSQKLNLHENQWPEKLDKLMISIVDKWVSGDPSYRMALKRALQNLLMIRLQAVGLNEGFSQFVLHAVSYAQSDPRIAYGILEVTAKCDKIYNEKMIDTISEEFVKDSFIMLTQDESRSGLIGRCLAALLGPLKPSTWFRYTRELICDPNTYQTVMTYFIEPVLKQNRERQLEFLEFYELCKPLGNSSVEIGVLKAAKNAKINVSQQIQSSEVVASCLSSLSRNLRYDALGLLCASTHKLSEKIPSRIFDLIVSNSQSLLAEGEPRARADVCSAFRALLTRVKISKSESLAAKFIECYMLWCATSLCPGMPYRCMASATRLVELFLEMGFPILDPSASWHKELINGLVNCVVCDFSDIREFCISILTKATELPTLDTIRGDLIHKAFKLMTGNRSGEAGAELIQLLSYHNSQQNLSDRVLLELRRTLEIASADLETACSTTRIHGFICSLRLTRPENSAAVLELACKAAEICTPPLTHNAPEGGSEDISNFCWKAIKEFSLLIEDYAGSGRIRVGAGDLEAYALLNRLTNMLTEITHWGAFSAVPPAFVAVAKLIPETSSKILWDQVEQLSSGTKSRSVTRRSAGLPLLITSCLKVNFEEEVISSLFELANRPFTALAHEPEDFEMPQVHGMNCLRAFITDADLSKQSARYLEQVLELCVRMFQSSSWSLKNCGAMLFSSLFKRLFGVRGLPVAASVFFRKFKSLNSLLEDQFSLVTKDSEIHAVFPGLAILGKLKVFSKEDPTLASFWAPVINLLGSKSWKIRELAAHAVASMTHVDQIPDIVTELIKSSTIGNQNELHGFGLAMSELLNSVERVNIPNENRTVCVSMLETIIKNNKCMETNTIIYKVYAKLGGSNRLLRFAELPTYTHLNPSLATFEVEQCIASDTANVDVDAYAHGWTPVLKAMPSALWTIELAETVLNDSRQLPDTRSQCLSALQQADHIELAKRVDTAYKYLNVQEPASVRREALKMVSKGVNKFLWRNWYITLNEFSLDSSPVECRLSAVESLSIVTSYHKELSSDLLALLFNLVSDEEEKIRVLAAQVASNYLGTEPTTGGKLESLIAAHLDKDYVATKLISNLGQYAEMASESFENPEDPMFIVEKESLYRDEFRSLQNLLPYSNKGTNDQSNCAKARSVVARYNFDTPLGANSNMDLLMIKATVDFFETK